ncbi:MAG: hypothetical protein DRI37_09095, partial [Chloroflexi bacterium]
IVADTESNIADLTTMGVPLTFTASEGKNITEEYNELNTLRAETATLRVKHIAYPEDKNIQKQYDKSKQAMQDSELYGAVERGFINSLSSDIINNNLDTTEGLQADINSAIELLIKDDKGNTSMLGKQIMKFSKAGFDGEKILAYLGEQLNKTKAGSVAGERLISASKNIASIKDDEDIVAYVTQVLLAPNSEIVKTGILANDLTDTIAKETYYRWLTSQGMSDKDATNMVIEAFPDYKEPMPEGLKVLSDYGVLMYPSYWTRINKPGYNMLTHRAGRSAAGVVLEAELGIDIETILSGTLPVKYTSWNGLINDPYEGLNVVPTNLW